MSHQSDEDIHKGRNLSLGAPRSRCDFFPFDFWNNLLFYYVRVQSSQKKFFKIVINVGFVKV